jgi:hypothetical protein
MRRWSWHRPKALLRRRLTVSVMLCAYLVTTVGIPVPARVHKPGDTPFPCQHHACGCASAEQCRNHCCCYTASERLAWARNRGITLPTSEESKSDLDCQVAQAAPGHCCAHHEADHAAGDNHAPTSRTGRIFSFTASKCHPISSLWCASGAVVLPPVTSWHFRWDVVERVSPLMASLDLLELSPPVPPPRV